MFAKIFTLTRPLVIFDLETTGLNPEKAKIVQMAYERHMPDGTVDTGNTLVNPGVPIPPETTEKHGIKDSDVVEAPRFLRLAKGVAAGLSECDFAGKNIRYDLRVLSAEMRAAKVDWAYTGACVIDADRLEAILEPRDLSSLYRRRLGKEPVNAHQADHDVRMTVEVLLDQLEKGVGILPRNLQELHDLQWAGWVDSEGKIKRAKDGTMTLSFGKYVGVDVRRVDHSYWTYILGSDFSPEFKEYAKRFALGKFS